MKVMNMKTYLMNTMAVVSLISGSMSFASVTVVTTLENAPMPATPDGKWYKSPLTGAGSASIVDLTGVGGNLETNAPYPSGAVRLTTTNDNADRAEVFYRPTSPFGSASTLLSDIDLGYSFYKVATTNASAAPSLKLEILAPGGTGDNYGQLIFEPYWNGAVSTGDWQGVTIDENTGSGSDSTGGWWWSGGFEIASGAGGPPLRSLAEWVAAFSASDPTDFANAQITGVSLGLGSYNPDTDAYADGISIKSGSIDQTFNFQVPEPATLGLFGLGGLLLGRRRR